MAIRTNIATARANLAGLCNQVTDNRETVIINRRGSEDVALISAAELSSLVETVHLIRSPKNALRLLKALNRACRRTKQKSIATLRRKTGINRKK